MSDSRHDFVIRGGTIVDGRGGEPFEADLAVDGDTISTIGDVEGRGREEIDARGQLVTPGFVDLHTHYDGQVIWENRLIPSSGHGVTTVVMGNCGVGFAPCRLEDHDRLVELMEGVEDIPGAVLTAGLQWDWETYPEYLAAVERRPHDINIASYLPHAPLRVYVMGERARRGEVATPEDISRMAQLTREAMRAGAVGFSTSRTLMHQSSKGEVIWTVEADELELTAIAKAMRSAGGGLLHIVNDYSSSQGLPGEFDMMKRILRESGAPLTIPMAQKHAKPNEVLDVIRRIDEANDEGLSITGQTMPRGVGLLFGFKVSAHPFLLCPSYRDIADLPFEAQLDHLSDPAFRSRVVSEAPLDLPYALAKFLRIYDSMFEMSDPIDYEPNPNQSIAARAARAGVAPAELAYDIMLKNNGTALLYMPMANYAHGNLDAVGDMIQRDDFVLGAGDGGAHYGLICDASLTTYLLTYWTRDRKRGGKMSIQRAIKKLCNDTARMVGFADRGILARGYRADINVIDYNRLDLHSPHVVGDLPSGGLRILQKAEGYTATFVNGQITYRDGDPTSALPGRLLRRVYAEVAS